MLKQRIFSTLVILSCVLSTSCGGAEKKQTEAKAPSAEQESVEAPVADSPVSDETDSTSSLPTSTASEEPEKPAPTAVPPKSFDPIDPLAADRANAKKAGSVAEDEENTPESQGISPEVTPEDSDVQAW